MAVSARAVDVGDAVRNSETDVVNDEAIDLLGINV